MWACEIKPMLFVCDDLQLDIGAVTSDRDIYMVCVRAQARRRQFRSCSSSDVLSIHIHILRNAAPLGI
jgi:hypothetical protein